MLQITIPKTEYFDNLTQTFVDIPGATLQLEHSLVSISDWESKWKKPYLSAIQKTREEYIDYVRCMTLTKGINPLCYLNISRSLSDEIDAYINNSMTATWFNDKNTAKSGRRVVTSELVYCWMIALHIPFECQEWHFSRLMTLIRVCNTEGDPNQKKMSRKEVYEQQRALNVERKRKLGTRG